MGKYHEILTEAQALHDIKAQGYGSDEDPYANMRMSEAFGIPAVIGIGMRMNDKMTRIKNGSRRMLEDGVPMDGDTLRDSFLDMINYAAFGVMFLDELENKDG